MEKPPGQPKRFRDCEDSSCPWLVALEKGSFTMGSPASESGRFADEGPRRVVTIGYPIAFTETEITRRQFRAFVTATKYEVGKGCWSYRSGQWRLDTNLDWQKPGFEQTDDHPVVCVNWHDAQAYAQWLSRKTGQRYRLPSEAEWEFATRAGSSTRYAFGDDDAALCAHANVADREAKAIFPSLTTADCDDGAVYTAPVRRYMPNAWGLYDMQGNVREWVQDCWRDSYRGAPRDGTSVEASPCVMRLSRGGAWGVEPWSARSAFRGIDGPVNRYNYTGLRLTRTLP